MIDTRMFSEEAHKLKCDLLEKLLASQAREAQLRGALERLQTGNWSDWPSIINKALSQTTEPPLLEVVREMKDALYWLVWLKDWKESEGKTPEYLRRNPLIWEQAREALNRAKEIINEG